MNLHTNGMAATVNLALSEVAVQELLAKSCGAEVDAENNKVGICCMC